MIRHMVFSRNRYFFGRLLTANDFETEQNYLRDKQRFRNLYTLGIGVVAGLSVTTSNNGTALSVTPGYAIDSLGREICVPQPVECPLPGDGGRLLVCVGYVETDTKLATPALSGEPQTVDNPAEPTRIAEGFEITLIPIPPTRQPKVQQIRILQDELSGRLALATLQRKGTRWVVDPASRPTRAKASQGQPKKTKSRQK